MQAGILSVVELCEAAGFSRLAGLLWSTCCPVAVYRRVVQRGLNPSFTKTRDQAPSSGKAWHLGVHCF